MNDQPRRKYSPEFKKEAVQLITGQERGQNRIYSTTWRCFTIQSVFIHRWAMLVPESSKMDG